MKTTHKIITAPQPVTDCTEQPLTGLDITCPADGFTIALVYATQFDEQWLIQGLQRVLEDCPYFSGRLFGLGSVLPLAIPNNEGVLFSTTTRDEAIPTFDSTQPLKPYMMKVAHIIHSEHFDHHTPILQVYLTNFRNGCILSISICRAFCDVVSMFDFMHSWAAEVSHGGRRTSPKWNRRDVQQLALGNGDHPCLDNPVVELEQPSWQTTSVLETRLFHLDAGFLKQLYIDHGMNDETISPQEITTAFIFIQIGRCRQPSEETTSLTFIRNARRALQLPANYLGNALSLRHFELSAAQLDAANTGSIAQHIRQASAAMTTDSLRRDIAFWQRKLAEGSTYRFRSLAAHLALQGGILIDDMSSFDFYGLDFGTGKPVWVDTPLPVSPTTMARSALMLPAPPSRGGIDVHVTLPPDEMVRLYESQLAMTSS